MELLKNQHAVPCKWVFQLKQPSDCYSLKYMAKLIAKGFLQEYNVDFDEIFSLVMKMTSLRSLLRVVAIEDLELLQLDVKMAFLHGDLDEEIYMEQPKGFRSSDQEHLVCRLKKSLYCLKQAPWQWYRKFDVLKVMRNIAYIQRTHEMDHPYFSYFTWMICYSLAEMSRSLLKLYGVESRTQLPIVIGFTLAHGHTRLVL